MLAPFGFLSRDYRHLPFKTAMPGLKVLHFKWSVAAIVGNNQQFTERGLDVGQKLFKVIRANGNGSCLASGFFMPWIGLEGSPRF